MVGVCETVVQITRQTPSTGYIRGMMFKIINLSDGSQKDCSFEELSTSLVANCEILRLNESGLEAIGFVSHKTLVFFAVEFADYALQNYEKKRLPEAEECIALVTKWIEDDTSVSNEELRAAANAAYTANAIYAVYAAYDAAYATNAAAYYAAYAAYAAADAAADAAGVDREKEFIRQGTFILDFLKSGKNLFWYNMKYKIVTSLEHHEH
jgi:hypothetical protein